MEYLYLLVVVIEGGKTVKIHQIPERLSVNHAGNMFNAAHHLENILHNKSATM
jgi:hypothetical protein